MREKRQDNREKTSFRSRVRGPKNHSPDGLTGTYLNFGTAKTGLGNVGKKRKQYKQDPFFKVSHTIWESREFQSLNGAAIRLYVHLCKLRNRLRDKTDLDNPFWRTDSQLLKDLAMSRNTLKAARAQLVEKQFIYFDENWDGGRRFGPRYIVLDDCYQKEADQAIDEGALEFGFVRDVAKFI